MKIKALKTTFSEFKDFIMQGNIIDMAIGVIIGNSFKSIVSSLVDNMIMPLIGLLLGGKNFEALSLTIKDAEIKYGLFIQNVVDFLIIAACLFVMLKIYTYLSKLRKNKEEEEEEKADPPQKSEDILLLEEIRDLLKKNGGSENAEN